MSYDRQRTYDWNYAHPPGPPKVDIPAMPGRYTYCGLRVASPLSVAAGPLLNGRWIVYYAALGFDVLTYKTVRSAARPCYPLPNLVPVPDVSLRHSGNTVTAQPQMQQSWAVSFGMPSQAPDIWRRDVEWTRTVLPAGKRLSVSVVGTIQEGWSLDDLAADYARCAAWAVESGADIVEANFSCPNVATRDGELFRQPEAARVVAQALRASIGQTPLILKIGHIDSHDDAAALVEAVSESATALAMTNSVAAEVKTAAGEPLFGGQQRGICGRATFDASVAQVKCFQTIVAKQHDPLRLIGVGGVDSLARVREYQAAGAEAIQIATAAMLDPQIARRIKTEAAQTVPAENSV